jgi:serine/threonine protein kinase
MSDDDASWRQSTTNPFEAEIRQTAHLRIAGWKVFGRYTLETRLGRGGMSVVWRAHDELLDESVALRFIPKVVARDAVAVDDLRQKTARARLLHHPHIIRVNDFMRDESLATVSMEYLAGMTLEQQRLEQPGQIFSASVLAPLIGQLCSALDYAHQVAMIVHGGLKPTNILVTPEGVAKITDFGISRSLAEARLRLMKGADPIPSTRLYLSPQQANSDPPSPADDIYSFGAVLYELLLGETPSSLVNVAAQMRLQESVVMAAHRAEAGVQVEQIPLNWKKGVAACLARDPAQRPSSGKEIASLLGVS